MNAKDLGRLLGTRVLRAWLASSAFAILGFAVNWFIDGDDPLQSDDPYIVGFVFAIVAACFAIVYTVTETIAQRVSRIQSRGFLYGILLVAWCLLLLAGSCRGGEAAPALEFAAAASLVIGLLTYPLCRYRWPGALVAIMSCMGVLLIVMYCVVWIRRAQGH